MTLHTSVPLGDIHLVVDNVREANNGDLDVDDLMASIPLVGLLEPLGIGEAVDGRYPLIFGFRRYKALKELGYGDDHEIPVVIIDDQDRTAPESTVILQLTENLMRKDLTPGEISDGFYALRQAGMQQKDIARQFGYSTTSVSLYLALQALPPVLKALMPQHLSLSDAGILARLRDPDELAAIWTDQLDNAFRDESNVDGLTASDYEFFVDELKRVVEHRLRQAEQDKRLAKFKAEQAKVGLELSTMRPDRSKFVYLDTCSTEQAAQHIKDYEGDKTDLVVWTNFGLAERDEVEVYTRLMHVPDEPTEPGEVEDPDAAVARREQERQVAEAEAKLKGRSERKGTADYYGAVKAMLKKVKVTDVKSWALITYLEQHSSYSPRNFCEMLDLTPVSKKNVAGDKDLPDWETTARRKVAEVVEGEDEKEMARVAIAMAVTNDKGWGTPQLSKFLSTTDVLPCSTYIIQAREELGA